MTLEITKQTLEAFVNETDRLGGPDSAAAKEYWNGFHYTPTTPIDQNLDPFSDAYFNQQINLYKELSSRTIDPSTNELLQFNVDNHIDSANLYALRDPTNIALHMLRLAFAIRHAGLPVEPKILDMGAGWGLSSEFFATLGCSVTAVDINPSFVELINRRRNKHKLDITAVQGTFDAFVPQDNFDAVFFYECLHHAMKPWELIARINPWLRPGGKIVFAGEPVNAIWWKHWGLRLDALSVYCIRKFGWFESGWTKEFILECFTRADMSVHYIENPQADIGSVCVATALRSGSRLNPADLYAKAPQDDWFIDATHLFSKGSSRLVLHNAGKFKSISFDVSNFRPRPVGLRLWMNGSLKIEKALETGNGTIECPLPVGRTELWFESDRWVPANEIGNGDQREISFHIAGATLV